MLGDIKTKDEATGLDKLHIPVEECDNSEVFKVLLQYLYDDRYAHPSLFARLTGPSQRDTGRVGDTGDGDKRGSAGQRRENGGTRRGENIHAEAC